MLGQKPYAALLQHRPLLLLHFPHVLNASHLRFIKKISQYIPEPE